MVCFSRPLVSDANYNRVHQVQLSGSAEQYTYAYNPYSQSLPPAASTGAGRLASVTGSLATIAYGYDALGRVNSRQIGGAPNYSVGYDSLGRMVTGTNSLCTGTSDFSYGYAGYTNRPASIGYPNGQTTSYQYFNSAGDQRLQTITNLEPATSGTLSQFNYTYNADGSIASWTRQSGTNGATAYGLHYDQADQLLTATLQNTSPQGILHQYGYGYDPVGNRTTSQLDGQVTGASYNNLNQLLSTQAGGLMQFTGSLSAPATVTVGSNAATLSGTTFTGYAAVTTGSNQVQVTAKNAGGQTTHIYGVIVSGSAGRSFTYDANGNMLSDGVNTYTWDAANRLKAVNEPGGGQSQFTYDSFGRRVQITESTSGTVTSTKNLVWEGMGIVEETNSSSVVTKLYFGQGVQIGGSNYYYTRDHLGSIREMTDVSGNLETRYDYDPYGQQMQLSGTTSADFGFAGYYFHQPSGLDLTLYRAYSALFGRWLSRDPIGESGGRDLYVYCENDPINHLDSVGLCPRNCGAEYAACSKPIVAAFNADVAKNQADYDANVKALDQEIQDGVAGCRGTYGAGSALDIVCENEVRWTSGAAETGYYAALQTENAIAQATKDAGLADCLSDFLECEFENAVNNN